MDTTVSGIGVVVVADLRAAGYMESSVGRYAKTIKALMKLPRGVEYSTSRGAQFASMTTSACTSRFSPARRFESATSRGVRLVCADRPGGPSGSWPRRRRPRSEDRDFVALDTAWEAEMVWRGLAPATREA